MGMLLSRNRRKNKTNVTTTQTLKPKQESVYSSVATQKVVEQPKVVEQTKPNSTTTTPTFKFKS